MTETGIRAQVLDELRVLAQQHDLQSLILFGSRARGTYHRSSDIDLAAYGGNIKRFALDADDLTSTLLRYDVVDMAQCRSQALLDEIRKDGIVLYEKVR